MEAILLACAANVQVGGRGHPARSTTVSKGWTRTSDKCGGYSGYSGDIAVDNEGYAKPSLLPVLEFARGFLIKLPNTPH